MSFGAADIWIIAAIVGIAVIGLAVFKLRKKRESGTAGKQFLGMGVIWLLTGVGYSVFRGTNPFDFALFNLGFIFTIAGSFQLLSEKYFKKST